MSTATQSYLPSEPVTLVISEIIAPNRLKDYEAWARGISLAAQQFEGFLGAEILRPRDNAYAEYVVIVRFVSYHHLRCWTTSSIYQQWIDKSKGLVARRTLRHMTSGMEIWFSKPTGNLDDTQPAYYKQVILGVLAVYPLILLANVLLSDLLSPLPSFLGLLISVTFVSALLTYPVMPMLTRILSFWLYPTASN
ncbi:antibiotic biosynthesis monooxygenase [Leptolyngbya cf. ectocarpi LEGE 11479]|uniref:Antibiotic biosynthesis monooxygenase n=1 Tax=Leptolyngbya cf. ectocarpi LEGE 11479 TaxID=1828722 RepID=A0A929FA86_LEPEC|nr:antibiotic biosynthesis monooxygenase [Leptolyngbya cf. ectocarpi LEGE 11479]